MDYDAKQLRDRRRSEQYPKNSAAWYLRATDNRDDCYLASTARRSRRMEATQHTNELSVASGFSISKYIY
ncbi:hypothetical protein TNCV_1225321 [Trichonephila clavipes]|nr:hypothetical protein TNCV_1225321 [Trichonephila clavipes]